MDTDQLVERKRIKDLWAEYSGKRKFVDQGILAETAAEKRKRLEKAMAYNKRQIMTKLESRHISFENFAEIKKVIHGLRLRALHNADVEKECLNHAIAQM